MFGAVELIGKASEMSNESTMLRRRLHVANVGNRDVSVAWRIWSLLLLLVVCGWMTGSLAATDKSSAGESELTMSSADGSPSESEAESATDSESLGADQAARIRAIAELIDRRLQERWEREGITPAPISDDAEFLRRVSLDLSGRIPPVARTRSFLADTNPNKRELIVDELIGTAQYQLHMGRYWTNVLIPESENDFSLQYGRPMFEAWVQQRLRSNVPYNEFVRELITTNDTQDYYSAPNPALFYASKQNLPENLASSVTRQFLGVRLECAQCHDHPFDRWTRRDFWGVAAFFQQTQNRTTRNSPQIIQAIANALTSSKIEVDDTGEFVGPTVLDGEELEDISMAVARRTLADWVTDPENRYFSRMAVNRMWAYFFGIGIVDPLDDFADINEPTHPELLDDLANEFADSGFDMQTLIKGIVASKAYQRTSRQTDPTQSNPRCFARMSIRELTREQVFDSLSQATGHHIPYVPERGFVVRSEDEKSDITSQFRMGSLGIDPQTTILQSLVLMNGAFVSRQTSVNESLTLAAILDFPDFDLGDRVDALYLAALCRFPTDSERSIAIDFVQEPITPADSATESGRPFELDGDELLASQADEGDSASERPAGEVPNGKPFEPDAKSVERERLADLFWVLLNSSEFLFNH